MPHDKFGKFRYNGLTKDDGTTRQEALHVMWGKDDTVDPLIKIYTGTRGEEKYELAVFLDEEDYDRFMRTMRKAGKDIFGK